MSEATTVTVKVDAKDALAVVQTITGGAIRRVVEQALIQREKGIVQYGQSIEDADLSPMAILQHAFEESVDQSVYIAQAMTAISEAMDVRFNDGLRHAAKIIRDGRFDMSGPAQASLLEALDDAEKV